jgi:hypothetical protein
MKKVEKTRQFLLKEKKTRHESGGSFQYLYLATTAFLRRRFFGATAGAATTFLAAAFLRFGAAFLAAAFLRFGAAFLAAAFLRFGAAFLAAAFLRFGAAFLTAAFLRRFGAAFLAAAFLRFGAAFLTAAFLRRFGAAFLTAAFLRFGADFLAAATYFSNRNGPIRHRTCSGISVSLIETQCQHFVVINLVRVAKYFLLFFVLS